MCQISCTTPRRKKLTAARSFTQVYILQRDMWRPEDDWKIVKRKAKETDTLADPMASP